MASSSSWLFCLTVIAGIQSSQAGGVNSHVLQQRGTSQTDQAGKGNTNIAIVAAAGVTGCILLALVTWRINKIWNDREAARHAAAHPEMAQAALLASTTTSAPPTTSTPHTANGPSQPRRPRRQPSTQTVPEYSEQAGDEEMVLGKADQEETQLEHANLPTLSLLSSSTPRSSESDAEAHYAATAAYTSLPRRTSYTCSRSTWHDIENPAPELRLDRVDTAQTANTPSLSSNSDHGHQPLLAMSNDSVLTLDEIPLDGMAGGQSPFMGSPAYVSRSRSRSIDAARTVCPAPDQSEQRPTSSGSTLSVPQSSRQSGFMSLFPRRQSNTNGSPTILPLHQPLTESRREALRNREISAPIGETLVKTSYTYPKAGINPIQAAWIGSRDHITRLTTYLDTAPPAFDEEDQFLEMDRRASRDANSTSAVVSATNVHDLEDEPGRPSASNVLTQMEEESVQLSSLVYQQSLRRSSLPPHMVALPPSLPVSPSSPRTYGAGNSDWPVSRAASLARARSLANNRISTDQQNTLDRQGSVARQRIQSANQSSPTVEEMQGTPVPTLPRSLSPSPIPQGLHAGNGAGSERPLLSISTSSSESSLEAGI